MDEAVSLQDVTVAVPTWRREKMLDVVLAAVRAQPVQPGCLLVVGRALDRPAQAVAMKHGARWIEVTSPGHVAPIRAAITSTETPILAVIDDDAEPTPGWLEELLHPFADPRVACVGGRVVELNRLVKPRRDGGRLRWYGEISANVGARVDPHPVDVDGVVECNWAWRTEILRKLSFDPILDLVDAPLYGLDLTLQAKYLGYRVLYTAKARVLHHAAPRDLSLDRDNRSLLATPYVANYTYIVLKHVSWWRRLAFAVWWSCIGDPAAPGLFRLLSEPLRGRHAPSLRILHVGLRARRAGLRSWSANRSAVDR